MNRKQLAALLPKDHSIGAINRAIDLHIRRRGEYLDAADAIERKMKARMLTVKAAEILRMEREADRYRLNADRLAAQLEGMLRPMLIRYLC